VGANIICCKVNEVHSTLHSPMLDWAVSLTGLQQCKYEWICRFCELVPHSVGHPAEVAINMLDGGVWSTSQPNCFTPGEEPWHPPNRRLGGS